jgi:4-carboxymuconolactone decarboxylase
MSDTFHRYMSESQQLAEAWRVESQTFSYISALDKKTERLAYLAVLPALCLESGIAFHVGNAKDAGATRDEVAAAILVGISALGNVVTRALALALQAYDSTEVYVDRTKAK